MSFTKEQLAEIKELKASGLSMAEIRELLADDTPNTDDTPDTPKAPKASKVKAPDPFKGTTDYEDESANVYVWHCTPKPKKDGTHNGYSAARLVIEYQDGNYRKNVTVAMNVASAIRAISDSDWTKILKNAAKLDEWVASNMRDGETMADASARISRD